MMRSLQFQILIPAYNAADVIDETMQSIWQQRFDRENIYTIIVDFGSTDGTYQKILRYDSFHLGIYQVNKDFTESRMAAEARRIAAHLWGVNCCQILLWPGDVIYPDCLEQIDQAVKRYGYTGMIISETDVKNEDGSIVQQPALYKSEKVISGMTEYMEYLTRGYQHNVMCFGGEIYREFYHMNGQMNERIWWNKSCFANFERDAVYIPERLGYIRERYYKDELREILLRWDGIMEFRRAYACKYKKNLCENKSVEENLVRYTLWRSCLLEAKGDEKQAKACFLISTVLFPAIRETQIYQWMEKYVMEKNQSVYSYIQVYFQMDGH